MKRLFAALLISLAVFSVLYAGGSKESVSGDLLERIKERVRSLLQWKVHGHLGHIMMRRISL